MFDEAAEILTVCARLHRARERGQLRLVDVAHAERNLLETPDHQSLAFLDGLNVARGLHQRLVRAGIEPRHTSGQLFDDELTVPEIRLIDIGNLELASGRRLQSRGDVDDLVVVEIETGDDIGGFRPRGLFLEADRAAVPVELDDAVTFGIANLVTEYGRPMLAAGRCVQIVRQMRAVENVVAEGQRDPVAA